MSAIRPDIPATLPQTGANHPNTAVRAAQTAFFRAALGQASAQTTGAPSPAGSTQASARATAPQGTTQTTALRTVATPSRLTDGEAPSRNLRPGSLLDIRI